MITIELKNLFRCLLINWILHSAFLSCSICSTFSIVKKSKESQQRKKIQNQRSWLFGRKCYFIFFLSLFCIFFFFHSVIVIFYVNWLSANGFPKGFPCIILFNPLKNPRRQIVLLSPFHGWENSHREVLPKWNFYLCKVARLARGGARNETQTAYPKRGTFFPFHLGYTWFLCWLKITNYYKTLRRMAI